MADTIVFTFFFSLPHSRPRTLTCMHAHARAHTQSHAYLDVCFRMPLYSRQQLTEHDILGRVRRYVHFKAARGGLW